MNQARLPRAWVEIGVDMTVNGLTTQHKTRDVGLGGMLIDCGEQLPPEPGTEVKLSILGLRTVPARVLRANKKCIALVFSELNDGDFGFLNALQHRRAG